MNRNNLVKSVLTALLAAVICILAPLAVPIGAVPISLGTLAIYLVSVFVNRKVGTAAVALYILLGLVGLPVFTGWTGGLAKLAGPTGGYIVGYIPMAYLIGVIVDKLENHVWSYPVAMVAGTVVLYAFGTAWYSIQAHTGFVSALAVCALPFLPGDALKIIAASAVAVPVRKRVKSLFGKTEESKPC